MISISYVSNKRVIEAQQIINPWIRLMSRWVQCKALFLRIFNFPNILNCQHLCKLKKDFASLFPFCVEVPSAFCMFHIQHWSLLTILKSDKSYFWRVCISYSFLGGSFYGLIWGIDPRHKGFFSFGLQFEYKSIYR